MLNSKHPGGESRSFKPSAIVITAIAICGITLGAATLLPAAATPTDPTSGDFAGGDAGYLPAQIANQAREIEPMPEMYE